MTILENSVDVREDRERCRKNRPLLVLDDDRESLKIPNLSKTNGNKNFLEKINLKSNYVFGKKTIIARVVFFL